MRWFLGAEKVEINRNRRRVRRGKKGHFSLRSLRQEFKRLVVG